jgi:hypothetical protein
VPRGVGQFSVVNVPWVDLKTLKMGQKAPRYRQSYRTGKVSWQKDAFWRGNHVHDNGVTVHARFLQGGDWDDVCGVSTSFPAL